MTKLLISMLLLTMAALGQRPAGEEAEWVKIRALQAIYEQAVSSNQIEHLRPYVAKGFHGVLVNGRSVEGFDDLVVAAGEIRKLIGTGGSYRVKTTYAPGSMFGDLATAHGTAQETVVTSGGKTYEFQSTWLVELTKEDGAWKMYRMQATLDPVNNPFVADTVRTASMIFGGCGIALGALAGYLLRGRRKS